MLGRDAKATYYLLAGPIMRVNASLYRRFRAPKQGQFVKVHLGPGQKKYMTGWINVDANMFTGKCDVWCDLHHPLPFYEATVDAMYSHHVVEHLAGLHEHFRDVYRCLKPGGGYRVGGPNGDGAIQKFLDGDGSWFGSWPDNRKSIGGRLDNLLMCRGEHLAILTRSFLEELLLDAGFVNLRTCIPSKQTFKPELFADALMMEEESDFDTPHTLIIEAEKPVTGGHEEG